jgi:hypothetical protein
MLRYRGAKGSGEELKIWPLEPFLFGPVIKKQLRDKAG